MTPSDNFNKHRLEIFSTASPSVATLYPELPTTASSNSPKVIPHYLMAVDIETW